MYSLLTLIKKDLKAYLDQPTGFILLIIFVASISYIFFTAIALTNEASLRPLFNVLPWLLAVFIPAVTMRLFSEEERDGTLEILFTQPIPGLNVILGKFFSGVLFVCIGLLFTIFIPILLATAANLDIGALIAQYLGSIFLIASLVSIGIFTSSSTQNQVMAFMFGLVLSGILMSLGLDLILGSLPSPIALILKGLSPLSHFSNIARGVLTIQDVLYFGAITSTFLSATYFSVRRKSLSHMSALYSNLQIGIVALVVLSLLVGWFGSVIGGRLDLTSNRQYTLSDSTREILRNLDDIVTIKLFASGNLPVQVSLTQRDIDDFLGDLESSSSNVRVFRINPDDDEQLTAWAELSNVRSVEFNVLGQDELQLKRGYFGLAITYLDRQTSIPFIDSSETIEYQVASSINKIVNSEKKVIGFLSGHNEKDADMGYAYFINQLKQQYDVAKIIPEVDGFVDFTGVDVLAIAGPQLPLNSKTLDSIRKFIVDGGNALIFADAAIIGEMDTGMYAQKNSSELEALLESFGVILLNNLVYDSRMNQGFPIGSGSYLPYPYWPRVTPLDRSIAGGAEGVVLAWASSISLNKVKGLEYVSIFETSPYAAIDIDYLDITPGRPKDFVQQDFDKRLMGVAVSGNQQNNNPNYRMIIVGDSDWLLDGLITLAPDNVLSGLNLVDWLAQEDALASIRSKVISGRQLIYTSRTHKNIVEYGNVIGVPILIGLIGFLFYMRRKRISLRTYEL